MGVGRFHERLQFRIRSGGRNPWVVRARNVAGPAGIGTGPECCSGPAFFPTWRRGVGRYRRAVSELVCGLIVSRRVGLPALIWDLGNIPPSGSELLSLVGRALPDPAHHWPLKASPAPHADG